MTLVLWSGGCDSTLALHDVAVAEGSARALSVVHADVAGAEESKAARGKLLRRFKRLGLKIQHATVEIQHSGEFGVETPGGIYQPTIWLSAAMLFLGGKEDLYLGYVRGDDFWHHKEDFERSFRGLQAMRYGEGVLRYPVEWDTKADVIRRLQTLGLYSACWYCEKPRDGRRCRECAPCRTHRTALWQIEQEDKVSRRQKVVAGKIIDDGETKAP